MGESTLIAPFYHITDGVHGLSKNALMNNQPGETQPIVIRCGVWIASSCTVLKSVKTGDSTFVGANSVVNRTIEPYSIVAGSPADVIGERK